MANAVEDRTWQKDGEEKRASVQSMFSEIAPTYDLVNSLMSFRLHYRWRRMAVRTLNLAPGAACLDICCGTGSFLEPLSKAIGSSGKLVGIDFCAPMLDVAAKNYGNRAQLAVGDACCLPVVAGAFDSVSVGWGLRNVPSVELALSEVFRVLKPGGRFVSLDMARPKGVFGTISERVFHRLVPFLGSLFGKRDAYTYLPKSTLRFLSPEDLERLLQSAGFVSTWRRSLFFGNIGMVGGQKP